MTQRTPEDGSRISRHPVTGEVKIRPGNKLLRDIPPGDRLVEVGCHNGGSRRGGAHLVGVVEFNLALQVRSHPAAQAIPGVTHVLCRCSTTGHLIDHGKLLAAVQLIRERMRYRALPLKGRTIDVRSVAPNVET